MQSQILLIVMVSFKMQKDPGGDVIIPIRYKRKLRLRDIVN